MFLEFFNVAVFMPNLFIVDCFFNIAAGFLPHEVDKGHVVFI